MDQVRLLKRHLKSFEYIQETGGEYNSKGIYEVETAENIEFKAVPMPISQYDLKLFPQGALNYDDIKIYTKYDLQNAIDKNIKRLFDGNTYRLINTKPFREIADIKIYILKRLEGES